MSVSLLFHDAPEPAPTGPRSVLITGAAGKVGLPLARASVERGGDRLRLMIESEAQRSATRSRGWGRSSWATSATPTADPPTRRA